MIVNIDLPPTFIDDRDGLTLTRVTPETVRNDEPVELAPDVFVVVPAGSDQHPVMYIGDAPILPGAQVAPGDSRLVLDEAVVKLILDEAAKHVGYREGRGNRNAFSEHFGRPPEMWCADFVSYVYERAGRPIGPDGIPLVAAMANWFKENGELFRGTPKKGDVIFFNNTRKGRWNHVGIVERVDKRNVYTIEGNVGGKKGGVARRSYALTARAINGYGRIE